MVELAFVTATDDADINLVPRMSAPKPVTEFPLLSLLNYVYIGRVLFYSFQKIRRTKLKFKK